LITPGPAAGQAEGMGGGMSGNPDTTVLVVDDTAAALKATARVLDQGGYRVLQAASGDEALVLARMHRPQLVLLDVVLPDISGPEVLRRIRADPAMDSVSVVLLSSRRTSSEDQATGLDSGAEGYIARPIANQELLARVRSHLRQRELIDQVRASEARLRKILNNQADGVLVVDHAGTILFHNPAAERLFAKTAAELDAADFGFPIAGSGSVEIHIHRPGGDARIAEMSFTDTHWEDQPAWIVSLRDISERLEMEEQLRRTLRMESIGQLTGGIAHDFNNLLTVILGNAELLLEELPEDSRLRSLADMVMRGAQRGSDLTHRLLAFARKQPLDPKIVDINRLIGNTEELLRRTLGEDVEIELIPSEGLWPALIDPGQLEDVLLNLALNARDAMPEGGRLIIETSNTELDEAYAAANLEVEPGEYVLVAVSDTGRGIPSDQLEQVFEPFFTTKEASNSTGLGLPMVYGFIKQSRGHVKIYSEAGEGTTVKMYLPRAMDNTDSQDAPADTLQSPGGSETILLVEDDTMVRNYVAAQLGLFGYHVIVAVNGVEALDMLQARDDIDLLFTDIVMPGGMNGRELADSAQSIRPNLKVLFTSGYTENAIVHHGRLDAGVHFLSKPYRRAELAAKLRQVLAGKVEPT